MDSSEKAELGKLINPDEKFNYDRLQKVFEKAFAKSMDDVRNEQFQRTNQMLPKIEKAMTEMELLLVIIGVLLIALLAVKLISLLFEVYLKPIRKPVMM
ncbi:hypothetical protein DdX_08526 [Ditylenchus destructor]|uniref:Uncharacterized protein n=1 Tax=Ditylenchus destructor TaxID=166010 RepID=A0AAD4N266_9BILA|nr:hypothetical protein DdX_08526 [Ditylenchus destructor]